MQLGWSEVFSLGLLILFWFWIKTWMYWWIRGIKSTGYPPPIGCLLHVWTNHITVAEMTMDIFDKNPKCQFIGTWIFMKPVLLIKDPRLVHQILAEDTTTWQDRGFNDDPDLDPLAMHLINLEKKRWKIVRSWLSSSFGMVSLRSMYDTLTQETFLMKQSMVSSININTNTNGIDSAKYLRKMVLNSISRLVLGLSELPQSAEPLVFDSFKSNFWTNFRSAVRLTCPSLLKSIGTKRFAVAHEVPFITLIDERLQKHHNETNDLLQVLIDSYRRYKKSDSPQDGIDDRVVSSNALVMIAGGYDTTATALTWTFYELANSPKIQDKVHLEIHKVLEVHGELNQNALSDMQYLDNVISEVLRLHPSVTMTVRVASNDTCLKGHKVSSGIQAFIPIYAIQRDPANFPDPETFNPDRFDDNDIQRIAYLPFGKGPRICLGWRLGLMVLKFSVITMCKDYKISINDKTILPITTKKNALFLTPSNPIYLNLHKRNID